MSQPTPIDVPVFNRRDFVFIADLVADIAYTFDFDGDDVQAVMELCERRLKRTNNRFKREVFDGRVMETWKEMIGNGG